MKKSMLFVLLVSLSLSDFIYANQNNDAPVSRKISIVGGGIVGALESYYAYQDAQNEGVSVCVTVYEKGNTFSSTNTSYNIVPSLTTDEILSVVPRGSDLVEKLSILFSNPGGIRVDDVEGVNDSASAINFKNAVAIYGSDKNHDDRTLTLLMLGKRSMDLWQQLYDKGDAELKAILKASNFNPCHESTNTSEMVLHDGYRIDLIYGIPDAESRAMNMKSDYEKLGYKNCKVLSPDEVVTIDPFLADFCQSHSEVNANMKRIWEKDAVALWRPGGCVDTCTFLPKFYAYLKNLMGHYEDSTGQTMDCFNLQFDNEVTGVEFDPNSDDLRVMGLKFSNGTALIENQSGIDFRYVFCPGESVGTLHNLGFDEPAYAAFAGPSLLIDVPLASDQIETYKNFFHCMEVHQEGIVLAWQARFKEDRIFIGVGGTKAFYGDKQPNKDENFAKNRNLVQLNMINHVLPEFISMLCGYNTKGKILSADVLTLLEDRGVARRWVGRRAVAYDGFPTLGALYCRNHKISNARCTTHLGSGGVSFAPGAISMSRGSENGSNDAFVQKVLQYADSRRTADNNF